MRVLIQHPHREGEISGVLTYLDSLTDYLDRQGVSYEKISTVKLDPRAWSESIRRCDVVLMNSNDVRFALLCRALGRPIVLRFHFPFFTFARRNDVPMTYRERTRVDLAMVRKRFFDTSKPLSDRIWCVQNLYRLGARMGTKRLAARCNACSEYLAKTITSDGSVVPIHNGFTKWHEQSAPKGLKDLAHPLKFSFVGRLVTDKGVDLILRAAKRLADEGRDFQIELMGTSSEEPAFQKLVQELGIERYVTFRGQVKPDEVGRSLATALAMIAPSRWPEPLGMVVLEASAVQTVSIHSGQGGLPECGGQDAIQFRNEDVEDLARAMRELLDDPQEALVRGERSFQFLKQGFSEERTFGGVLRQLRDVARPSSGA